MLIHDAHRRERRRSLIAMAAILVGLGLLLWLIARRPPPSPYAELPDGTVYCGAESSRGQYFWKDGHRFAGAATQSDACARHGRYGSALPASDSLNVALVYTLEKPRPGQAYRASVWQKAPQGTESQLFAEVDAASAGRQISSRALRADSLGWQQLELYFHIPYGKQCDRFSVGVAHRGPAAACFDDFLVEALPDTGRFQLQRLHLRLSNLEKRKLSWDEAAWQLRPDPGKWARGWLRSSARDERRTRVRLPAFTGPSAGEKPALQVRLSPGNAWEGLTAFTLRPPGQKHFLHEWLLRQCWAAEGIITPRYDFVELYQNGRSRGLYALEGRLDTTMLNQQGYPSGPILYFSDRPLRRQGIKERRLSGQPLPLEGPVRFASLKALHPPPADSFPQRRQQIEQARRLLEQYRSGTAPLDQIFALDALARYLALCELFQAYAGTEWPQLRFYYNPITSRLHPIGYWGYKEAPPPHPRLQQFRSSQIGGCLQELLTDEQFQRLYFRQLYRMSQRDYLKPRLDSLAAGFQERLEQLRREFPSYQARLSEWLRSAAALNAQLLPADGYSLIAYAEQQIGPSQTVKVTNHHLFPLEVIGYGRQGKRPQAGLENIQSLPSHSQMGAYSPAFFKTLSVSSAARYLFYRLPGLDTTFSTPILPYAAPNRPAGLQQLLKQNPDLSEGPYAIRGKEVVFEPGRHQLRQTLIVPRGYTLVLQAGAELELAAGRSIIVLGRLRASGTAASPIRIEARGGGMALLNADGPSQLAYVLMEGLQPPASGNWRLPAAFTVYESEAAFANCAFVGCQGKSVLRLIRTSFQLTDCFFPQSEKIALRVDYSNGALQRCRFEKAGQCALRLYGSRAELRDCSFQALPDQAISIREGSFARLRETEVRSAGLAVEALDGARVRVQGLQLLDCQTGFAAFRKKPEFGPAQIVVESCRAENTDRLYRTGPESKIDFQTEPPYN